MCNWRVQKYYATLLCIALTFHQVYAQVSWFYDFHAKHESEHAFPCCDYNTMSDAERQQLLEESKAMFYFGYDNYLKHGFPLDELDPIHCTGRGPDYGNVENININDVLGDYSLTLIDTLDTLVVLGNVSEFHRAVRMVIDTVRFDIPTNVQVFEATIRVLGGLLAAHLVLTDHTDAYLSRFHMDDYSDELLMLARELATRLLVAFDSSRTGLPFPRVNLRDGMEPGVYIPQRNISCPAGVGSLLVEFGVLSRLVNDPVYELAARRAVRTLVALRSNATGLLGNAIDVTSNEWIGRMAGIGAGLDSFYEYLLKAFILFGDDEYWFMYSEILQALKHNLRTGRKSCNPKPKWTANETKADSSFAAHTAADLPLWTNVDMLTGATANNWVDSLAAAFGSVLTLGGDVDEAVCVHTLYDAVWRKFGLLPDRFNWAMNAPDVRFYPLRPEFVETTYYLYRATRNPFYLHVGKRILRSLNHYTKAKCGYATVHDVTTYSLEDRMESFFLSETCKYLYLLFDENNHFNVNELNYLFTTEGHIFPITAALRNPADIDMQSDAAAVKKQEARQYHQFRGVSADNLTNSSRTINLKRKYEQKRFVNAKCAAVPKWQQFISPLRPIFEEKLFQQLAVPYESR